MEGILVLMERITIEGLEVFAFHGCNPGERRDGQIFLLDILLEFDSRRACVSDDLRDTVNYSQVAKRAAAMFIEPPCNLIERAAYRTARGILKEFAPLRSVTLRVHKPDAPLQLQVADIIYEITLKGEEA